MRGTASRAAVGMEVSKHRLLRERLLAECPRLDEETLADTLEGLTDLKEIIAAIIRSALVDQALAKGLKSRIDEMDARLDRLEHSASTKRQLALSAMKESGLRSLREVDFTASTRPSPPALVVTSEKEIPAEYWLPQPPRLDRQGILSCLKRGAAIPGATLNNPQSTLAVRTK